MPAIGVAPQLLGDLTAVDHGKAEELPVPADAPLQDGVPGAVVESPARVITTNQIRNHHPGPGRLVNLKRVALIGRHYDDGLHTSAASTSSTKAARPYIMARLMALFRLVAARSYQKLFARSLATL